MSKFGREQANRALAQDPDMAYVFRKINEMGQAKPPDQKPLDQTDKIMAEIMRMWPLLSERDRLELQGICQLKVFLNSKK